MGHRAVFLIAIFAVAFGLFFGVVAFRLPAGNAAVPASLAFNTIGMLGVFTAKALKDQGERIARLERHD